MSGRTVAMMLLILAINWGGFVTALVYGMRRDRGRGGPDPGGGA